MSKQAPRARLPTRRAAMARGCPAGLAEAEPKSGRAWGRERECRKGAGSDWGRGKGACSSAPAATIGTATPQRPLLHPGKPLPSIVASGFERLQPAAATGAPKALHQHLYSPGSSCTQPATTAAQQHRSKQQQQRRRRAHRRACRRPRCPSSALQRRLVAAVSGCSRHRPSSSSSSRAPRPCQRPGQCPPPGRGARSPATPASTPHASGAAAAGAASAPSGSVRPRGAWKSGGAALAWCGGASRQAVRRSKLASEQSASCGTSAASRATTPGRRRLACRTCSSAWTRRGKKRKGGVDRWQPAWGGTRARCGSPFPAAARPVCAVAWSPLQGSVDQRARDWR